MNNIPRLDISDFDSDRQAFTNEFGRAYQDWGFAGIVGHGIDHKLIKSALRAAEQLFALSDAEKRQYQGESGSMRGYVPFGVEKAKDSTYVDLKEFYHIGRDIRHVNHLPPNVWPSQVPEFQSVFEALYLALDKLLKVVALYLQLPLNYFKEPVSQGEALLRVLHYPPIIDQEIPNLRAAAHEDINLITLLVGSEQDGLEVLSRNGDWVPISMIENTVICNVGDMLQRLTNNKLPSTTHRVVNPVGKKALTSRYSIPFFVHPSPATPLDCLASCIDAEHPASYPPITAGEFLTERLSKIGLLK